MGERIDWGWLYSFENSPNDLKDAVRWFSKRSDAVFERGSGEQAFSVPFIDLYRFDLENFCVLMADVDGRITDREIEKINWVLDDNLTVDQAYAIERQSFDHGWPYRFPATFKELVELFGKGNQEDLEEAVHIAMYVARLYYHLAQFIYCVDNEEPFDENSPGFGYVVSFAVYVRRVKVTGFRAPQDEESIEQTLEAYEQVRKDEIKSVRRFFCGSWRAVSGNAISKQGLSDLLIKSDGTGYGIYPSLFGTKEEWLDWQLDTSLGFDMVKVFVPSKELEAHFLLSRYKGEDKLIATVTAPPSLKGTMAVYVRSR